MALTSLELTEIYLVSVSEETAVPLKRLVWTVLFLQDIS